MKKVSDSITGAREISEKYASPLLLAENPASIKGRIDTFPVIQGKICC